MKIEGILTTSKPQKFAAIDAGLITSVREMHLDMLVSELVTDVAGQTDVLVDRNGRRRQLFTPFGFQSHPLP